MSVSVHDNFLLSYTVNAETKEIRLHTKYPYGDVEERTDVVFTEVAAYHFEADNLMTIIFDVEETTLEFIYEQHQGLFERLRNYAWPTVNCEGRDQLLKSMQENGVKAYSISSSLGLEGWVWAKGMFKQQL